MPFTRDGRVLADSTLRQTVRVTVGGPRIRLRFSNAYGTTDLPLTEVRVARPEGGLAGVFPIAAGSSRAVTFGGRPGAVIPAGAQVVSDPLDFPLAAGAVVTVTIYLLAGADVAGGLTSHPGSRTRSYLLAGHLADHYASRSQPAPVEHWYLLAGVEVQAGDGACAVIALGDSLTDGRGSTTDGNDRWPDQFSGRLRSGGSWPGVPRPVAVVNQGIGGNRVLRDGIGPSALARLDRDVLAVSGARWLVVFEGVNDIGTTDATAAACEGVAADLVFGYEQIIARARAAGLGVYGATLTPFGGHELYDDPGGHREAARQAVNEWFRSGTRFDGVVDFDRAVRDPDDPRRLRPEADSGDHLHLNPVGYRALADAVPAGYFGCDEPEERTARVG
ncbi:MAG TPA: SGNH/GDSL hydrolase family protein [Trebonia sp.]|nr:SGNH/GDSL hydrolase family protein [Trebonia sp.]